MAALTAVDSIDWIVAEIAARSLPAGTASAEPKASDGPVEMLRLLKSTKDSAVHARTRAINQLKALLITVPAALREQLQNLGNKDLLAWRQLDRRDCATT